MNKTKILLNKTLLLLALLFVGVMVNAQSLPSGKLNAITKQNPAFPVQLTYYSATPVDGDLVLIAYIVQGHGTYTCFEVLDNEEPVFLCSGRATEQPVMCFLLISREHFVECFFDLFNVHGYGGPYL